MEFYLVFNLVSSGNRNMVKVLKSQVFYIQLNQVLFLYTDQIVRKGPDLAKTVSPCKNCAALYFRFLDPSVLSIQVYFRLAIEQIWNLMKLKEPNQSQMLDVMGFTHNLRHKLQLQYLVFIKEAWRLSNRCMKLTRIPATF